MTSAQRLEDIMEPNEAKLIRKTVREVVEKEIMPVRRQIDEDKEHIIVNRILKKLLVDLGFQKAAFPPEFGGLGLINAINLITAVEELARGDAGIAVSVGCVEWALAPILFPPYRNEKLLKEFAPMFMTDKPTLACFAMTEPESGCDIENFALKGRKIRTRARLEGDYWVINGVKQWPSNTDASLYCVVCTTDPALGEEGIALIYVPRETEGVSVGEIYEKAGMAADKNGVIYFDNVKVPKWYRAAGPGDDAKLLRQQISLGAIGSAAISIGSALNVFEIVNDYTGKRIVADKPIKEHSICAGILADMCIGIETARTYLYHVTYMFDHPEIYGPRWSEELHAKARIAKVYAAEVATMVAEKAMQLMGSFGYSRDSGVEKHWRDIVETIIWEGGAQLGRLDIARYFCNLKTL